MRESWYNRQGSEIRRDINGETRFSASVILSNNSEGVTHQYNNRNQHIASDAGVTLSYNANGHTASKTDNGNTTEYRYNHGERLIEVKENGNSKGEYAYNPYGRRIKKTVNGETTWYLYTDQGLAAEYTDSGELIKEYHYNPEASWMTEPLFQRTADDRVYYYQNDHLGTPQKMVTRSGGVVWSARYQAFGEVDILVEEVGNNLRMAGQYFDGETGVYYNYFRTYDPSTGRYLESVRWWTQHVCLRWWKSS